MFTTYRTQTGRVLGLLVLVYILLAQPPKLFSPGVNEVLELVGFALLVVAAFGRIWCLLFAAGHKNDVLLTEGPYSIVRNPLYVFSFLGALGFGLVIHNPLLALVIVVFFAVSYPLAVASEETHLSSIFGAAYADYRARTPRWIPNWKLYHEPALVTVSPAKIRIGIFDAMWFLWAFLLWEALEELRETGVLTTIM